MLCQTCPSRQELRGFCIGQLPPERINEIAEHLEACEDCGRTLEAVDDSCNSLIDELRRPRIADHFASEAACQNMVAQVAAAGGASAASAGATGVTHDVRGSAGGQRAPARMGEYEILLDDKLGSGGMGDVYRGRHVKLGREVAIKLVQGGRSHSVSRFLREMKALGKLDHPNIVRATDAAEHDGKLYLVMDLVGGMDLSRLVKTAGKLSIADACELVRQAAVGLHHVHVHGMVHRDVKPANLMLTWVAQAGTNKSEPMVKILDMGLAALWDEPDGEPLTEPGGFLGTPAFMAPEQFGDTHEVTRQADVYSLGCTLFYLLAGEAPYSPTKFTTTLALMWAHIREPIPPIRDQRPDVPGELAAVLGRMLAKDPFDRHTDAAELARCLEPFAAGSNLAALLDRRAAGLSAESSSEAAERPAAAGAQGKALTLPALRSKASSRRLFGAMVAGCIVLLAAVIGWTMRPDSRERQSPPAPPPAAIAALDSPRDAQPAPQPPAAADAESAGTPQPPGPVLRPRDAGPAVHEVSGDLAGKVELASGWADGHGGFRMPAGEELILRIEVQRDCYVGIWNVEQDGSAVQIFPNRWEPDHLVKAKESRQIPGNPEDYGIRAKASTGREWLWVLASTQRWEPVEGQRAGDFVHFATPQDRERLGELVRGVELFGRKGAGASPVAAGAPPAAFKTVIPFEVLGR